jgi:predicted membrane-bound mannosyltransferase/sugar lactone lactonase YvrE
MTVIEPPRKQSWLDRPIFNDIPFLTNERLLFAIILGLMIVSRLYQLGARVMSHDESLHVYYSWLYSIGQGYQHTPTTHGPLQFHLIALTYLLFGDSDFTARLPHALASIATVLLIWKWRRYLGRTGTLIAAGLVLISPFMLYYGRYARNETFVALLGLVTLYAILRYLETGKNTFLLLLTIATALHFTVKETAFIYTAQAMVFLALYLINKVFHSTWRIPGLMNGFLIGLSIGILLLAAAIGLSSYNNQAIPTSGQSVNQPIGAGLIGALFTLGTIGLLISVILLIVGFGWKALKNERSFSMLIVMGTMVLPQLSALPVSALGWNPLDYAFTWPGWNFSALWSQGPFKTATVLLVLIILSISLGLLWDWKRWLVNAGVFWGIYIIFYTSIFSNWQGLATGMVGSLGYWLVQQGVHRGSQPWYYYLLIQIPLYEFLPALGFILAGYLGLRRRSPIKPETNQQATTDPEMSTSSQISPARETAPIFGLLFWWASSSLLVYSIAGEKMPWLTVHITLPMILLTGWALGQIIDRLNTKSFNNKAIIVSILILTFFIALAATVVTALGANPPFQGKTLVQLSATGGFLLLLLTMLFSLGIVAYFFFTEKARQDMSRLAVLLFFGLLSVLTIRTSIRAAYIHPNDPTEYLVYAHGASGIGDVMNQIENISRQTTAGENLSIAYDNSSADGGVSWPFTWYLRHYPNKAGFSQPSQISSDTPVVIVDQTDIDAVNSVLANNYYRLDYIRMVWPNQDYFDLTWPRIKGALTDPTMRQAIWDIWFNRDYSQYAKSTGSSGFALSNWNPSDRMELLIRKDIAATLWNYNILQNTTLQADPYASKSITLAADQIIGSQGSSDGQLDYPHGIAFSPDGTMFVADTNNNRIEHFSADGNFLSAWGSLGDVTKGAAPMGTFNQPFALAVSPDARFIYVTDTWNHRIQKFSSDGTPIKMWGKPVYDPSNTDPNGLWGPRGIAIDSLGRVFVADTGNKRVIIYDADGNFISQIGTEGMAPGQFEEPVGLALDANNYLYAADTWNQRIQVFAPNQDGTSYTPYQEWSISGWYSQSLDNKPYLAIDNQGHIFTTDPDSFRILEFTTTGGFVQAWGDPGTSNSNFGMPAGIAMDSAGHVWVSDADNNRIMRFTLP